MLQKSLTLPLGTPHIVVDPLKDFTEGEFVKCYGKVDVQPVVKVVQELTRMTQEWRESAHMILCRSLYTYDQFKVNGLEKLCTTEEGRTSVIPHEWFKDHVLKRDNSLLTGDRDLDELLGDNEFFGITGLTTTSCVIKTIKDCKRVMNHRTIVVPADAVGVRQERTADGEAILAELSDPQEKQVIVVKSWRDITHEQRQ